MTISSFYAILPLQDRKGTAIMPLYSCRSHADGEYAITKLDDDLNPEATYLLLVTTDEFSPLVCECPASARPSCRHRDMLPMFLASERVNTGWVLDWDGGKQWRQYVGPLGEPEPAVVEPAEGYIPFASDIGTAEAIAKLPYDKTPPAPTTGPANTFKRRF